MANYVVLISETVVGRKCGFDNAEHFGRAGTAYSSVRATIHDDDCLPTRFPVV